MKECAGSSKIYMGLSTVQLIVDWDLNLPINIKLVDVSVSKYSFMIHEIIDLMILKE